MKILIVPEAERQITRLIAEVNGGELIDLKVGDKEVTLYPPTDAVSRSRKWTDPTLIQRATEYTTRPRYLGPLLAETTKTANFRWMWDRFRHADWKPLK